MANGEPKVKSKLGINVFCRPMTRVVRFGFTETCRACQEKIFQNYNYCTTRPNYCVLHGHF